MHWKKTQESAGGSAFTAHRFTSCRIPKSRPTLALSTLVSSSSSYGSGTRSWLAGHWGSGGRTALVAAAWWWTRSSWIHPPALPAEVWSRAYVSFWSGCALGTTVQLEEREGGRDGGREEEAYNGLVATVAKSRSPPRLRGAKHGVSVAQGEPGWLLYHFIYNNGYWSTRKLYLLVKFHFKHSFF